MDRPELLPVAGFVLAGGKSTRMGADKALLPFRGRPMVEIAVEKLREFCAEVGIAGNRDDLSRYAPVVHESRMEAGPAAGVEAGLRAAGLHAAGQPWVLFIPVDVPLVPMELLRGWVRVLLNEQDGAGCVVSYLLVNGERQPAFCALRRECLGLVTAALDRGERRLAHILRSIDEENAAGRLWLCDAARFAPADAPEGLQMQLWFSNVNTAEELASTESAYLRKNRAS